MTLTLQNLNNRLTFGWQESRFNFKLITDGVCDLYLFSKNMTDIFKLRLKLEARPT